MEALMRCPSCKKTDAFRSWEGPIKRMGVQVIARGERCSSCGETLFTDEEVGRQDNLVAAGFVSRGVRTGAEFKFVRKIVGLKATEVADILGVRPETVSRWERDEVEIPRLAAFALGELYDRPRVTRERLQAFARP
jgi:putative zinc finger/helix-turn-helix YgiT family protein